MPNKGKCGPVVDERDRGKPLVESREKQDASSLGRDNPSSSLSHIEETSFNFGASLAVDI